MAGSPRVVILAAGLGTRMRSTLPKVLHPLGGRPLIDHVIDLAASVSSEPPVVVVNPAQPDVAQAIAGRGQAVEQAEAYGTGDALRSVPAAQRSDGALLVLSADVPLVLPDTLRRLLETHQAEHPAATMLTFVPDAPAGLGRVVRDRDGKVVRVVEEADLAGAEAPAEANAGVYVFEASRLWPALERLSAANAQGEYYLTDAIEILGDVATVPAQDPEEALGINDRTQLAQAEAVVRRRTLERLMRSGVTVEDPATTYVDVTVEIGADTVIRPLTHIRGSSRIGRFCEIGPGARLRGVRAAAHGGVGASELDECELGEAVEIGAYCRVRPNTTLAPGVQLGTHAEVKNSTVGAGTRINHFACVLDSQVGRDVNIGAGTVTCNFDGATKHRTWIGDGVFVGTNSTLVAPLRLGDGCYVAAGSVVTEDVPPGALAVGRSRQRNVEGWVERRKAAAQ